MRIRFILIVLLLQLLAGVSVKALGAFPGSETCAHSLSLFSYENSESEDFPEKEVLNCETTVEFEETSENAAEDGTESKSIDLIPLISLHYTVIPFKSFTSPSPGILIPPPEQQA